MARQLLDYLYTADLMPDMQSAYRAHHSTETAVLKVLADILRAVDSGDLAVLVLLDLSVAFDTVDHAASSEEVVWSRRPCSRLVPVLPQRSISVRPLWGIFFNPDQAGLRCPTGIGSWADPVSSIHCGSASTGSCTWP